MKLTNRWNRIIYRLWSPVYDATVGHFFFPGRKRALQVLDLQPGERVLLVGCGTGADLPLLTEGVTAIGVDLSLHMLARARSRLPLPGRKVALVRGDAQRAFLQEGLFDAVIFNLILSVVPDGAVCLRESLRLLRPGGRAVIFDKFLPQDGKLTLGRRIMNFFSTFFGTDITRRFHDMVSGVSCTITLDEPSLLHGTYRVILITKETVHE